MAHTGEPGRDHLSTSPPSHRLVFTQKYEIRGRGSTVDGRPEPRILFSSFTSSCWVCHERQTLPQGIHGSHGGSRAQSSRGKTTPRPSLEDSGTLEARGICI